MKSKYDHMRNLHSALGPKVALAQMLESSRPASLLDVGCGPGRWISAAQEYGVPSIMGIDGNEIEDCGGAFGGIEFETVNFEAPWQLGRQFDVALCLEVAEHLSPEMAEVFVESLAAHTELVFFSAACPGQDGQNHVNCQWPVYWQALFNRHGFRCDDAVRWRLWNDDRIEWWYRQNMFTATRDETGAGLESRIPSVIHPAAFENTGIPTEKGVRLRNIAEIQGGSEKCLWYLTVPFRGMGAKISRWVSAKARGARR